MKTIIIWIVRIFGLLIFLYGLLGAFAYLTAASSEYLIDWLFYPVFVVVIGLSLMILSRRLITMFWKLFEPKSYL